jgi:protein TonB
VAKTARPVKPKPTPTPVQPPPPVEAASPAPPPETPAPPVQAAEPVAGSPPAPAPPTPEPESGATTGARAIYQPMPEIPPELRRQAMRAVAVVRFTIAPDGTARVELREATPDPQLNRILISAFAKWRFFPATERGKPVASSLTLRVPISVE